MWTSDFEPFSYPERERVTLCEALEALVAYLPYFERRSFTLGRWVEPEVEGLDEYVLLTDRGERFVQDLHSFRWIRRFDDADGGDSSRAEQLDNEEDPHALDDATPEELSRLLSGCLMLDEVQEGHLLEWCEKGLFLRVLRRADVILQNQSKEDGERLMP